MCGVTGICSIDQSLEFGVLVKRMAASIPHRGPDAQGQKVIHGEGCSVGLGHRRLSIVDLSGGAQPMSNEDGTVWLSYNGEVYNHANLRQELEGRGHRYKTRSDTESILHAYEEWGPACVERLRGMFAFAIWDNRTGELYAARDRIGIKPFYYTLSGGTLVFASEIKGILASGLVGAEIDLEMVPEQMTLGYLAGENSLFRGIRKLMPGHWLRWRAGEVETRKYWDIPAPDTSKDSRSDEEWIEEFSALFNDAVSMRLMSDVPLGVFLSGGLDSSTIAATMSREIPERLKTFSVGFESQYYSELGYAAEVADHLGTDHYEVVLTCDDFFKSLPRMVWHEDEPIRSAPSVALYYVAKLAREHVKVVLTGEGSDELFAGYDRYWATLFNYRWGDIYERALPRQIRERCVQQTVWQWPISSSLKRKISHTFLGHSMHPEEIVFDNWYAIFPRRIHGELFTQNAYRQLRHADPYRSSMEFYNTEHGRGSLEQLLYSDQKSYLVELLMKQDNMSMAASLESRVPFLDHHLIEFATRVPQRLKLDGRSGKRIVKEAAKKLLPESILKRKKTGFPVPFADWLRSGAGGFTEAVLNSERFRDRGIFDSAFAGRLLAENSTGERDHTEPIWSLLNFELWARIFIDGDAPDTISQELAQQCPVRT